MGFVGADLCVRPIYTRNAALRKSFGPRLYQHVYAVKVELRLGVFGGMFQAIIHKRIKIIKGFMAFGFDAPARDCESDLVLANWRTL